MDQDTRLKKILTAAEKIKEGNYHVKLPVDGRDDIGRLAGTLNDLVGVLDQKFRECAQMSKLLEKINSGLVIDDVLNFTYTSFRPIIPFDRIGVAFLEDEGQVLRLFWVRSDFKKVELDRDYSAKMRGSSLKKVIRTGRPRVINDLRKYYEEHPHSESTRKILKEGVRSSLTCPLIAMGKPIGFIFFSSRKRDTYKNEHKELYRQIAGQLSVIVEKSRMYQKMIEINDLKNNLLGIAMHDLRSPISLMNSRLDLIMEGHLGDLAPAQLDSLKGIRQWSEKMLTLIEELLDVSAIESGQLNLTEKNIELKEYLSKWVAFNEPLAAAKQIELKFQTNGALPKVMFDPERIAQVVNNLIGNAIKYSPSGSVVQVSVKKARQAVRISVSDQGKGILKREMVKVFDYFVKGKTRPTGGESSTGLGLAICKRMVEAHGGRIWVDSTSRKGSTFTFELPIK